MRPFSVLTMVAVVATVVALGAQQNPMRAGRWQVTMQMQMPNMPMEMPATTTTTCITQQQLDKDPTSGLPSASRDGGPNACKVSDYKFSGNTASWKVVCTGQQAMTADGEMTFMQDSYAGTMKMNSPQGAMSMKLNGKRIGECTP
jgi:hypothetical protein